MSNSNRTLSQTIRDEVDALPYPGWVCMSYAAHNARLGVTVHSITTEDNPLQYTWGLVVTVNRSATVVARWDTLMEAATYFEMGGKP